MRKLILYFILGIIFCGNASAGVATVSSTIGIISYSTTTQIITIHREGGGYWVENCSVVQIQFNSTFPGVKELLSIVLTAKVSGSEVSFFGDCDPNGHFVAHQVNLP